jgi:hypothetical protein
MANVMPASRASWESAVAAYRAAEAAVNSHPYCKACPADANYEELEQDQASYLENATSMLRALIATPSPDAPALVEKLSIYAKEFGGDKELSNVITDARRFLLREQKPSPIMAMHTRYEETMAEFGVIEKAENDARKRRDESEAAALERGSRASCREADALRTAILHQVPDSWTEAMALQFHIVNAFDLLIGCTEPPEFEQEALQTAIDTLFDFMCCEVEADHEQVGLSFRDGANRAFFQRRRRTGVVEA